MLDGMLNDCVAGVRAFKQHRNYREATVSLLWHSLSLEGQQFGHLQAKLEHRTLSKARSPRTWIQLPQGCCRAISLWDVDTVAKTMFGNSCSSPFLDFTDLGFHVSEKILPPQPFCSSLPKPLSGHLLPGPLVEDVRRENLASTMPWESGREGKGSSSLSSWCIYTSRDRMEIHLKTNYPASSTDITTQISRDLASLFWED